jgi:hypothetical protein
MSLFVVDIEADGPIPGDFSMLSFGAIKVEDNLDKTFESGFICPISPNYEPETIKAIGISEFQYLSQYTMFGKDPLIVMQKFNKWIQENNDKGHPVFISDNNGFDWMFICWYFHHFIKHNPFGFSSRRIGDIYCGLLKDMRAKWKHLRKTAHTHNPIDDAKGNAEVILHMLNNMGLI